KNAVRTLQQLLNFPFQAGAVCGKFARRQCSPCCRRRATQTSDRVPFGISRGVQTWIESSRKTHNRTRDVRCLRCTPLFTFLLRTPEGYSACKCYWPTNPTLPQPPIRSTGRLSISVPGTEFNRDWLTLNRRNWPPFKPALTLEPC